MKQVIAMHGWSGDQYDWKEWSDYFMQNGWSWSNGDRGYRSGVEIIPRWKEDSNTDDCQQFRAIIGHSLGPHLLDKKLLQACTHIIFIASFSSFLPRNKNNRLLKKGIKAMQDKIGGLEESKMLQEFLLRAFEPDSVNELSINKANKPLTTEGRLRLKKDLEKIEQTNSLPNGIPSQAKVLVVEGQQDAIVSLEARKQLTCDLNNLLSRPPTNWEIPNSGHALLGSLELIQRVKNWLEE